MSPRDCLLTKAPGMRCARCAMPYPLGGMSKSKALGRKWLGIEKDSNYIKIAKSRLKAAK